MRNTDRGNFSFPGQSGGSFSCRKARDLRLAGRSAAVVLCSVVLAACSCSGVESSSTLWGYPAADAASVPEYETPGPVSPRASIRYPGPDDAIARAAERQARRAEIGRLERRLSDLRRGADGSDRADPKLSRRTEGAGSARDTLSSSRIKELQRGLRSGR